MPGHPSNASLSAARALDAPQVPVTLVCGAVGAGKTQVLEHWMRSRAGTRFAVIAEAASARSGSGSYERPAVVFHTREAIEAVLTRQIGAADQHSPRGALWQQLASGQIDEVLVEVSAHVEPASLALVLDSRYPGHVLVDRLTLNRIVTVVDCATVQDDYASTAALAERHAHVDASDTRTVANVVAAQIESADIVVLNKIDRAGVRRVREVHDIVGVLNPDAIRVETSFGEMHTDHGVDRRGAMRVGDYRPGWLRKLDQPLPATGVYAVARLVYRRRRPFHPERLARFLDTDWPWALRVRGQFWLASRPEWAGDIQQAGCSVAIQPFGYWWASEAVGGAMPDEPGLRRELDACWHPLYGDRRQHIAILGIDFDTAAMEKRLDYCLLNDTELAAGWAGWRDLRDPWPVWA